jgi:hypothetical protein
MLLLFVAFSLLSLFLSSLLAMSQSSNGNPRRKGKKKEGCNGIKSLFAS